MVQLWSVEQPKNLEFIECLLKEKPKINLAIMHYRVLHWSVRTKIFCIITSLVVYFSCC